jgi:hypothetical protein
VRACSSSTFIRVQALPTPRRRVFFISIVHGIQGLPPRGPQPGPLHGGQRLRQLVPDADPSDADPGVTVQRQVPQERAQARGVRQRGRPGQRRGRQASRGAVLQHPRRARRPRGRRLPLHRHQGQRARHHPRHPRQAQPHRQLLWQEPPQWLHLCLITCEAYRLLRDYVLVEWHAARMHDPHRQLRTCFFPQGVSQVNLCVYPRFVLLLPYMLTVHYLACYWCHLLVIMWCTYMLAYATFMCSLIC